MRTFICICSLLVAANVAAAQDGLTVSRERSTPPAGMRSSVMEAEVLSSDNAVFLPGFREYLVEGLEEDRDAIHRSMTLLGEGVPWHDEAHPSVMRDYLVMRSNFGIHLWRQGSGTTLLQLLGQMLLRETVRFGYVYAREKVREQSLSEMDYLYLPQGPGVTRTTGEVTQSALQRGDMQAYKIWYDLYQEFKNRPPGEGCRP
ncbi:MAG: hypothetical protein C0600_02730 [Ignavibacteria bacterium]|nr:MAG: hypothetical protein C0600_02730 [Ignavibacteria bacterium]